MFNAFGDLFEIALLPPGRPDGRLVLAPAPRLTRRNICAHLTPHGVCALPDPTRTSREQTFDPRPKWALVPGFFAPGTRDTFSPGWWIQLGVKVYSRAVAAPGLESYL